jgi:AcrR family transcriptional regulator
MSDAVQDEPVDGRSSRWDTHRAQRREQLIDAAIAAVNEHGTDVGMDQIAATARTSKPVIYRYFADKDELHRAMGERIVGVIVRALQAVRDEQARGDADPRALLWASIDAYLSLLAGNPELFRFVTGERRPGDTTAGSSEPAYAGYSRPVADVLTAEFGDRLAQLGLDVSRAQPWGEAVVGFIAAASRWWIEHPDAMTRAELTDYLAALLWGGVAGVLQLAGHTIDARPAAGVFPPAPGRTEI